MSKRNTQEAKRAARERLRVEQEKQKKKEKARRQIIVGVSVVAVLAVAGGIGYGVMKMNEPSGWEAAKQAKLVKPANTEGKDGTTVTVGSGKKHKVDLYEDLRCPACAQFEQGAGSILQKGAEQGKFTMQYHLGDLIDQNMGGEGSKKALSALGASLNVSKDAFNDYHKALFSAKNHPEEASDKFADSSYLLKVADTVPALKKDSGFKKDVEDGTYDRWALSMVADFDKGKVQGTPTMKVDGKTVDMQDKKQLPAALKKLGIDLGSMPKQ